MANRITLRLYGALTAAVLLVASPAAAQFTPRTLNDPATGEQFHIEGAAGFWMPTANMSIASEALGIIGSAFHFTKDLGLTDQRVSELQAVLRPARKHKLRFAYIPIEYAQENTIQRDIKFNGQ